MDLKKYNETKKDLLKEIDHLSKTSFKDVKDFFTKWIELSEHPFFLETHYFKPSKIYPYFDVDDDLEFGDYKLDLYKSDYLKQAWNEKSEEGLGGDTSFLIGGINDAAELVFLNVTNSKGIAIMHHDDVFLSTDIDDDILKSMNLFQCPIEKLLLNCFNRNSTE